jgi:hypothetical protein
VDDSVDESPRERLVASLAEAVRAMLVSGDGEGAKIALRALEEIARATPATKVNAKVADLALIRARASKPEGRGD